MVQTFCQYCVHFGFAYLSFHIIWRVVLKAGCQPGKIDVFDSMHLAQRTSLHTTKTFLSLVSYIQHACGYDGS